MSSVRLKILLALALPLLILGTPLAFGQAPGGFDPELEDDPSVVQPPKEPVKEPPKAPPQVPTNTAPATNTETEPPQEPLPPVGPYTERGPADLKTYINEGRTPNFIRINAAGAQILKSDDFSKTDTLDFKSKGGELFNVKSVKPLERGASVEIDVSGQSRWVYVSHEHKDAFSVCESEACMSSLADGLDFLLHGSGVSVNQAETCGVSQGPEGLVLPPAAPAPVREPVPLPPRRPVQNPPARVGLSVKPLWESSRNVSAAQGAQFTKLASDALDKYGQGLLGRGALNDARRFCPKFAGLTPAQKKEFFIHLMAGISRYESNFKLSTPVFDEDRYKARAKPYNIYRGPIKPGSYSMGLFQLSYSAAPGYKPQCRIDYKKDRGKDISDPSLTIYDPQIQMECAVTILNKWVSEDGGIGWTQKQDRRGRTRFQGGANYWSTLRSTNPATQEVIDSLKRFGPCWK